MTFFFVLCCSTQENTLVMLKEMFLNWIMNVFSHPDAFAFLRYHADLRLLMSSSLMCRLHLETQRREFDCNSFRTLFKSVLQISEERTGLSLLSGPNRPAAQKTKQFPITKAEWGSNLSPAQGGGFWGGVKNQLFVAEAPIQSAAAEKLWRRRLKQGRFAWRLPADEVADAQRKEKIWFLLQLWL